MAKKPISQSDTKWVKKDGKKGYVVQISTGKKVTGKVALVANTTKGKAGETQRYSKGVGKKAVPNAAGAGQKPGKPYKPKAVTSRPSSGSSAGSAGGSDGSGMTKAQRDNKNVAVGTIRPGLHGRKNRWNGKKWVPVESSGSNYQAGRGQTARPSSSRSGGVSPQTSAAVTRLAKQFGISPAAAAARIAAGPNSILAKAAKAATTAAKPKGAYTPGAVAANKPKPGPGPKKGDKKTTMAGTAIYDGKKWVMKK